MAREACVYVIAEKGTKYCKVGISDNPGARLSTIQTGNPRKLFVAFRTDPMDRDFAAQIEYRLLKAMRDFRKEGEWLRVPHEILRDEIQRAYHFVVNRRKELEGDTSRHPYVHRSAHMGMTYDA